MPKFVLVPPIEALLKDLEYEDKNSSHQAPTESLVEKITQQIQKTNTIAFRVIPDEKEAAGKSQPDYIALTLSQQADISFTTFAPYIGEMQLEISVIAKDDATDMAKRLREIADKPNEYFYNFIDNKGSIRISNEQGNEKKKTAVQRFFATMQKLKLLPDEMLQGEITAAFEAAKQKILKPVSNPPTHTAMAKK